MGLSVTKRIDTITQPRGGYLPKKLFNIVYYNDNNTLTWIDYKDKKLPTIQGLAVDYLTRYILTNDKEQAFHISILGAIEADEVDGNKWHTKKLYKLLNNIDGLNNKSIKNACKIVGYDDVYRRGYRGYRNIDEIDPPIEMINNIKIMVNRSVEFLKKDSPILKTELTFEPYTKLVSQGDGDYLTNNMLIDLKVSKNIFTSKWSLQILMYYLLGLHSKYSEYQKTNQLCIYNPFLNCALILNIQDISDEIMYKVSHEILGYKMTSENFNTWKLVDGDDLEIYKQFYEDRIEVDDSIDLSICNDGIYELNIKQYWSYLKNIDPEYTIRPKFTRTDHVIMLKRDGYLLFLSVSPKGKIAILKGASVKGINHDTKYLYENMVEYAQLITKNFAKYWNILTDLSNYIKALKPSKEGLKILYSDYRNNCKFWNKTPLSYDHWYEYEGKYIRINGHIHGCIIDLDYYNHIYINPFDGTVAPYYAISMYDKDVYKNVRSLIAARKPEFLEAFDKQEKNNKSLILKDNIKALIYNDTIIDTHTTKVMETDMYIASRILKPLQKIYDYKVIQVWNDEIFENKSLNINGQILQLQDGKEKNI